MKLKLNKQNVTNLSASEMDAVNGGRGGWSNFRTGLCNYSSTHGRYVVYYTNVQREEKDVQIVGCIRSLAAGDNGNGSPFTEEEVLSDEM